MMFSRCGWINVNRIERLLTFDTSFLSLQEEVVEFLTQQQLEVGMQLCGQALHGDGGQNCLLWGRQAADGGQALGRRVQPPPTSQTGTGDAFTVHWCADDWLTGQISNNPSRALDLFSLMINLIIMLLINNLIIWSMRCKKIVEKMPIATFQSPMLVVNSWQWIDFYGKYF